MTGGDHDYSDTDSGLGAGITPSPASNTTPGSGHLSSARFVCKQLRVKIRNIVVNARILCIFDPMLSTLSKENIRDD